MEALATAVDLLGSDMGWRNKLLKDIQYTCKLVAWYGLDRRAYTGADAARYQQVQACAKALSLARRFMIFFQWLEDLQEMVEAIRERKWAAAAIAGLEAANDLADDVITLYKAGLLKGKGGRTYNRLERFSDTVWGISNLANICVAYGKYRKAAAAAQAKQEAVVEARQALAVGKAREAERALLRRQLRRPLVPAAVAAAAAKASARAAAAHVKAGASLEGHETLLPAKGQAATATATTEAAAGEGEGEGEGQGEAVPAGRRLRRTRSDAGTGVAAADEDASSLSTASSDDSEGDEAHADAGACTGACSVGAGSAKAAAEAEAGGSPALQSRLSDSEAAAAAANKARFVALLSVLKFGADGGQAFPPALEPLVPALGAFPEVADHLSGLASGLLSTAKIWVKAT